MADPSAVQAAESNRPVEHPGDAVAPPSSGSEGGEDSAVGEIGPSGAWAELSTPESPGEGSAQGMLPVRLRRRSKLERGSMRVLATGGIIGLATVLGAVLVSQAVAGWIVGLTIGLTSVILAAVLWSSRQL
jgi:hypothetical protein